MGKTRKHTKRFYKSKSVPLNSAFDGFEVGEVAVLAEATKHKVYKRLFIGLIPGLQMLMLTDYFLKLRCLAEGYYLMTGKKLNRFFVGYIHVLAFFFTFFFRIICVVLKKIPQVGASFGAAMIKYQYPHVCVPVR